MKYQHGGARRTEITVTVVVPGDDGVKMLREAIRQSAERLALGGRVNLGSITEPYRLDDEIADTLLDLGTPHSRLTLKDVARDIIRKVRSEP